MIGMVLLVTRTATALPGTFDVYPPALLAPYVQQETVNGVWLARQPNARDPAAPIASQASWVTTMQLPKWLIDVPVDLYSDSGESAEEIDRVQPGLRQISEA